MILVLKIICCFFGLWFSAACAAKFFRGQTLGRADFMVWALAITGVIFLWGK